MTLVAVNFEEGISTISTISNNSCHELLDIVVDWSKDSQTQFS